MTKWESYRRTGMARSFYRPRPDNTIEEYGKPYYHAPSSTYYEMVQHDGRHFQRQYQIDFNSKRANESEAEVDFVVGSGNHSRTYLHRTSRNTLIELPLAWYAEKGGYWAMNPGYDRPDHQGRRRLIGDDCMFCHNSYPQIPAESERGVDPVFTSMPEGIDCQRCHGPGERHVALASYPKTPRGDVRAAIVNPARLNADRQMEVCLQCHLETTSFPLPNSIVRYERAPLSYLPGEPLQDFMLHFDRAVRRDPDDRFEIAGSAYRMQLSACFKKSNGALRCTICHDPHDVPRGQAAAEHYTAVCRQCHGAAFGRLVASGKHTSSNDCVGCHMPKRRTEDAVHVVMTDHYIQRRKPARDLLADIAERPGDKDPYRGEVVLYSPKTLPHPEDELYLAVAQVEQSSNLSGGIARLEAAIEKYHPERADYYMELANAWRANGQLERAIPVYQEALRRNPKSIGALQSLALCWMSTQEQTRAVEILSRALEAAPRNAITWQLLGTANVEQGKLREAVAAFQRATELDVEMPEAYNSLGGIWLRTGELTRSEPALRKAIDLDPNYTQAHNNLANLLAGSGRFEEARYHFEAALRAQPGNSEARYDYAVALARAGRRDDAQQELEATVAANPKAEAHEFLGTLLAAKGQLARAVEQYRAALRIRPDFGRANLHLGESLVDSGDTAAAVPYLRKAAGSSDAAIRAEALAVLKKLEPRR